MVFNLGCDLRHSSRLAARLAKCVRMADRAPPCAVHRAMRELDGGPPADQRWLTRCVAVAKAVQG